MARPEKAAQVEAVRATFDGARSVILADFTGLNVERITELRRLCRDAGVEFRVVKNTLAKLGVKDTPAEALADRFEGPVALAVSREAEHTPAKVLAKFAEEHEKPTFKAGFVDGNVIDVADVIALSQLPSKEELVAKLLGGIQGPATGLVACLQGTLRNLISVLNQIKDKTES